MGNKIETPILTPPIVNGPIGNGPIGNGPIATVAMGPGMGPGPERPQGGLGAHPGTGRVKGSTL